jgi:hypothetical protein
MSKEETKTKKQEKQEQGKQVEEKGKAKEKQKEEEKQEKEKKGEPELKIIREIKPEIKEIEQTDEFISEFRTEKAEAPVLKKIDLEQTVGNVEIENKEFQEKEEKEKEGAIKYVEQQDPGYFIGSEEEEERKRKEEERTGRIMEINLGEAEPEKIGSAEMFHHLRTKPVHLIGESTETGNQEDIIKYEKVDIEKPGERTLPFSPKSRETEIERRVKKYKKHH